MSSDDTYDALMFVLIEKVYPMRPELLRNDSKTAALVEEYVFQMSGVYRKSRRLNPDRRTHFQDEAHSVYYRIFPLEYLSSESLRKYIRQLWKTGAISEYITFRSVNHFDA